MTVHALDMENTNLHWPSVVKHYRLSAGLNQTQLADQLAVTQTMVSRWEAGGADPSRRIQELIFDLYWSVSATISRDVWYERIGLNPAPQIVIEQDGRIRAVSRGFLRAVRAERSHVEALNVSDVFAGDFLELFETLCTSGFFEGRVSIAESVGPLDCLETQGLPAPLVCHGVHKPVFMPGPEVLWLASGAEVTEPVYREIADRLGGKVIVKRAL